MMVVYVVIERDSKFSVGGFVCEVFDTYEAAEDYGDEHLSSYAIERYTVQGSWDTK